MPRPRKWRRVCDEPQNTTFGPVDRDLQDYDVIIMTVDEYETIRLIDLENMSQEECGKIMNIGRTTAQRIYNDAKRKLAMSLVNGVCLKIEGGDYELCEEETNKPCGRCQRRRRGKKFEG